MHFSGLVKFMMQRLEEKMNHKKKNSGGGRGGDGQEGIKTTEDMNPDNKRHRKGIQSN